MGRFRTSCGGLAILSLLALAACGGTSSPKPNDTALKQGLLSSGQLAGMNTQGTSPDHSIALWLTGEGLSGSQAQAESARLRSIGFSAGISEQLVSPTNTDRYGVSSVEQFKTAKGASAELADAVATNGPWTLFSVPGAPGARGFEQDGSAGGRNIAFTHGDYFYIIGSGWQKQASDGVPRATMIAVAQRLDHHVGG
jgi:hypothetical protein